MSGSKRFVYIIQSLTDPEWHYTGLCSDVQQRLRFHNEGLSQHTAKYRPWRVTLSIEFCDERLAAPFERYLKTGSGRAFAKRHFATS